MAADLPQRHQSFRTSASVTHGLQAQTPEGTIPDFHPHVYTAVQAGAPISVIAAVGL